MKTCDAVKTQNHGRDNGRRTGRAAVGLVSRRQGSWAAPVVLLSTMIFVSSAQAQLLLPPEDCATGRELITIPEVKRDENEKKLKAVLMLSDENRSMWVRKVGGTDPDKGRCLKQHLRYFKGWNAAADPPAAWPPPTSPPNPSDLQPGEPIPGPTLRARIGDLIQISFMNQIDTSKFPTSLDQGDLGKTTLEGPTAGCDEAVGTRKNGAKVTVYPPPDSAMPNCLHGSSTSNVHFHGTHTTPSTTGDNVLLYIRPALRVQGQLAPTDAFVNKNFDKIFESCEKNGSPTGWSQLPSEWRTHQETLLKVYDKLAPYKGIPGNLPAAMKLWPKNAGAIAKGKWPQYSVGAFPYCFRLPDYATAEPKVNMGQAPGTHWYHAHKHGSTALNVANGMLGALIIEGPYDDALRAFYRKTNPDPGLEEKVLVIQQLEPSLNMLSMGGRGTGGGTDGAALSPPPLSVNGRRQPFITMRPGQVQMWRIVNGAHRSFVQFRNFVPQTTTQQAATPCSNTETPCVDWRQTAQDGVQFAPDTYERVGKLNAQFTMAAANRVDLLVKAPTMPGSYALEVVESVVTNPDSKEYSSRFDDNAGMKVTLLTVKVTGESIVPAMGFIDTQSFPTFPEFLKDIPPAKGYPQRKLVFNTSPGRFRSGWTPPKLPKHFVDGKLFDEDKIEQHMLLGSVEEWTVFNATVGIAHPFHIHINPFQVVEVFDPNSAEASDTNNTECYADPKKPETWKPCHALQPPFVWWDVRAIPAARPPVTFDCAACPSGSVDDKRDACSFADGKCTVKIPGYFKMRSRFVDYAGVFVQHCHILAHEDVGMMQLVEVYTDPPGPTKEMIGYTHY
jgi:FtsP/CotA-like multicopper oxidase with cupredoxin domain